MTVRRVGEGWNATPYRLLLGAKPRCHDPDRPHTGIARRPLDGLDAALLDAARHRELREEASAVALVEQVVRKDLARTWRLAEVAAAVGMSSRSLQRALADVGERYSELLDRIRNREAARLLRESELTVTEVGYLCGFSDSAHFSRSFKKRLGKPPSAFRAAG